MTNKPFTKREREGHANVWEMESYKLPTSTHYGWICCGQTRENGKSTIGLTNLLDKIYRLINDRANCQTTQSTCKERTCDLVHLCNRPAVVYTEKHWRSRAGNTTPRVIFKRISRNNKQASNKTEHKRNKCQRQQLHNINVRNSIMWFL